MLMMCFIDDLNQNKEIFMEIRKTAIGDIDEVMEIYAYARDYMRKNGNPGQWGDAFPSLEYIRQDIKSGKSYVLADEKTIAAVFYFCIESEPTYSKIDGNWLNDKPYGVVHRIARGPAGKGAGEICLKWCFENCGNVRIDTHRDNVQMLKLLKKLGYVYCGIVWMEDGSERLAYQKQSL